MQVLSPGSLQREEWGEREIICVVIVFVCMQQMDSLQHLLIIVPWDFANLILTPAEHLSLCTRLLSQSTMLPPPLDIGAKA